jgi:hypothetical protein
MKSKCLNRISITSALIIGFLLSGSFASAQSPSRLVGTITAINGSTITVKTDADGERQVAVPTTATLKRIAPGQKDLSTAETIQFSDLAIGDRALVKLDPDAPAGTTQALQIVAVKQADLALKQQKDREDWQRRGVGGLVKSVDAASGVVVLSSGAGATAKTITVHITKTTMLKRYAPASVRFDAALPARTEPRLPPKRSSRAASATSPEQLLRSTRQPRRWQSKIWQRRSWSPFTLRRRRRCGGCRTGWPRCWRRA